ncbi:MAG: hypothetical protein GYB68_15985 [Chloroflexi bacterium]|nr:hypothetical protein [Chloroflexota bacterium]
MERTVPKTESDQIELYSRTYYSLLRSTGEIAIDALVETHTNMDSLLHVHAADPFPDVAAFSYTTLRFPSCIIHTRLVVLGQRSTVFESHGFPVTEWQPVAARARRRRARFDGVETLGLYIASRSDIDDIIPSLTAYQIEWNKLHASLAHAQYHRKLAEWPDDHELTAEQCREIADILSLTPEAFKQLCGVWGDQVVPSLRCIAERPKRFALQLLAGSLVDYQKATRHWWLNIRSETPHLSYAERRVYFVSSNSHSIVNLWTGHALRQKEALLDYNDQHHLLTEAEQREAENSLYYLLNKYEQSEQGPGDGPRLDAEQSVGVQRVTSVNSFELDAQIIEISKLRPDWLDPRLQVPGYEQLYNSDALIINVDYPLGMAAYDILTRVAENVGELCGVYILGKAATLNARVGDIMIPAVVHDEHSKNTYLFNNAFEAADVSRYLMFTTVLDNQKAVTVTGTFLQNARYMGVFYREGYTDIEMEAGPYLSAVYELIRPKRHPYNEIVSLHPVKFDVGIIHYASDKPLSDGNNLGSKSLSLTGVEPTYAASVAILKRIISHEIAHVQQRSSALVT